MVEQHLAAEVLPGNYPGNHETDAATSSARLKLSEAAIAGAMTEPIAGLAPVPDDAPTSAIGRFADSAQNSFRYNLVQSLLSAVTQIPDHYAGTSLENQTRVFDLKYAGAQAGSAEWVGNVVGNVAAVALQFGALYRFVGPGAAAEFERSAKYGLGVQDLRKGAVASTVKNTGLERYIEPKLAESLNRITLDTTAYPYISKSVKTGAIVGGVFTPTSSDDKNFLTDRLINAGVTGLAFGASTAASLSLKTAGSAVLRSDIVAGAVAGTLGGEINADGKSLATTGSFATWDNRVESMAAGALGGGIGGGLNMVHESYKPTTSNPGMRTIDDVSREADKTVVPGNPKPEVLARLQSKPPKADAFLDIPDEELTPDQRILKGMRIELPKLGFAEEDAKNIVRDTQSTMEMIKARSADDPKQLTITGWGGVRVAPHDYDYQLARLFGGLAAHEDWAIKTGGGRRPLPEGGSIMEALNKGAAEAGGTSIGAL